MKTIDVYVLQHLTFFSDEEKDYAWENVKLTTSKEEAIEWSKKGKNHDYDYETFKLILPQEIQVQSDY